LQGPARLLLKNLSACVGIHFCHLPSSGHCTRGLPLEVVTNHGSSALFTIQLDPYIFLL
jgi:hypothetical protein